MNRTNPNMDPQESKPKASICIPSYNHARFIGEALDSALRQTFDSFEVIVSDDRSTDGTDKVLAKFKDERLKVIPPRDQRGMASNWNHCVLQAKGDYIVVLSSDDKLAPDFLKEQCAILDARPGAGFAFCATHLLDANGKTVGLQKSLFSSREISQNDAYLRYLDGPKNIPSSTLFRKSLYDRAGGFAERYKICLDWDFWLKLLRFGGQHYNERPMAYYRVGPDKGYGHLLQQQEIFEVFEDAVNNCPENLKSAVKKLYPRIKKRLFRRAMEAAAEIRDKNREEADQIVELSDRYMGGATGMMPWLIKFMPYRRALVLYKVAKNSAKKIIKRVVWGIRSSG